jgi:hypothetical protein
LVFRRNTRHFSFFNSIFFFYHVVQNFPPFFTASLVNAICSSQSGVCSSTYFIWTTRILASLYVRHWPRFQQVLFLYGRGLVPLHYAASHPEASKSARLLPSQNLIRGITVENDALFSALKRLCLGANRSVIALIDLHSLPFSASSLHAPTHSPGHAPEHPQLVVGQQLASSSRPNDQPPYSCEAASEVDVPPPGRGIHQKKSRHPTFKRHVGDLLVVYSVSVNNSLLQLVHTLQVGLRLVLD